MCIAQLAQMTQPVRDQSKYSQLYTVDGAINEGSICIPGS